MVFVARTFKCMEVNVNGNDCQLNDAASNACQPFKEKWFT